VSAESSDPPSEDSWIPLADVSALPLAAVADEGFDTIGRSLRLVLAGLDDGDDALSAFGSFMSED
jgi:hypothetical protein